MQMLFKICIYIIYITYNYAHIDITHIDKEFKLSYAIKEETAQLDTIGSQI